MELTVDSVSMNTDLAEDYLKTYNNFSVWPAQDELWHVKKYSDDKEEYSIDELSEVAVNWNNITPIDAYTIRKLIEKIQENESLFCQLEYVTRKIEEVDVKNNLCLIYQYLQCDKDSWNTYDGETLFIVMTETTPLYVLGGFAALKANVGRVVIITSQKTAAVCHLFTDICAQNGLDIPLIFTADMERTAVDIARQNELLITSEASAFECTGVITESADIDSALDVFINSTLNAPWRIRNILVQESVYDEVKEALAARCVREPGPGGPLYSGGGKVFSCDALGGTCDALGGACDALGGVGRGVPLEAYRTSRELCELLRQHGARALSLWAADAQAAHEAALAAPATLVWLNDYACFQGPPASALPLYRPLYSSWNIQTNQFTAEALKHTWIAWNKMTKENRVKFISIHLKLLKTDPEAVFTVDKVQDYLMHVRDNSFATVESGKICMGVEMSMAFEDIIDYDECNETSLKLSINAVINGAPLRKNNLTKFPPQVLKAFENAGAPVLWNHEQDLDKPFVELTQRFTQKKIKVIRSNFGTIFAN